MKLNVSIVLGMRSLLIHPESNLPPIVVINMCSARSMHEITLLCFSYYLKQGNVTIWNGGNTGEGMDWVIDRAKATLGMSPGTCTCTV